MINFIIYEDNRKTIELYKNVITKFIGGKKDGYQIIAFERYEDYLKQGIGQLLGKKIFILDIQVPQKNGLDLAREIRASGDWLSQIIIVSNYDKYQKQAFSSKMLTLEFIHKNENVSKNLKEALDQAYRITSTHKAFSFQHNGEIYQIAYQDILFFEKNLYDNYSYLVTKNDRFKIKKSISCIEEELKDDLRFFKSHRSCIINLHNIYSVDLSSNTICFSGGISTDLLARNKKKQLKEKLTNSVIFN